MSNKTLVLATFEDEASADMAAASLKDSGTAQRDAIGVLALNEYGEVKAEKVGKRSTGKGAGIGLALALFTPVGLGAAVIGGGLLGALHHKGLGLDSATRDRLGGELAGGRAAVGVLTPVSDADFISEQLADLGGAPEAHPVSDDALDEAYRAEAASQS